MFDLNKEQSPYFFFFFFFFNACILNTLQQFLQKKISLGYMDKHSIPTPAVFLQSDVCLRWVLRVSEACQAQRNMKIIYLNT